MKQTYYLCICRYLFHMSENKFLFPFGVNRLKAITLPQKCTQLSAGNYSMPDTEKDCTNFWEGTIVFSHRASNSCGVAIMISKDLDIVITKVDNDSSGRYILLDCCCINNIHDQSLFAEYLTQHLEHYIGENILLAGDFNIKIGNTHNCHFIRDCYNS